MYILIDYTVSMDHSAALIAKWVREQIADLKTLPKYAKSNRSLYLDLWSVTGVHSNTISKFVDEPDRNITIKNLDKLVAGVRSLKRTAAQAA